MNEQPKHPPSDRALSFFGRIGADISHEMRNVLAVIGQYGGLLDDLVAGAGRRGKVDLERLKQVSSSIDRQVKKGTELMERLSRFSHATDVPTASFDLTALAGNLASLAQRRVTHSGCKLQSELPGHAITLTSRPFGVQHAMFLAIEFMAETVEKDELLTLRVATQGDAAVISVSGRAAPASGDRLDSGSALSALANDLGGSVEVSRSNGILSVVLTFPLQ